MSQLVIIKRTDKYDWGVFNRYGKILMRDIYWLHCRAWIDEQNEKGGAMADKILCPVCQLVKEREAKCNNCGCPGETKRISELEKPLNLRR